MAEEKKNTSRGVIIEFDFTALDGSQILFDVAKKILGKKRVDLTVKLEAMHLVGGNYQGAIAELFESCGVRSEPAPVAQELSEAFKAELTKHAAAAVTPGFKDFVKALTAYGLKVVIATRSDIDQLAPALADFDAELVVPYSETSNTYGNCKWDAWRRACNHNGLIDMLTAAVTGSGKGVKSALVAGLSAMAIVHDHVAYQDFGGADVVIEGEFNAKMADAIARMLHLA